MSLDLLARARRGAARVDRAASADGKELAGGAQSRGIAHNLPEVGADILVSLSISTKVATSPLAGAVSALARADLGLVDAVDEVNMKLLTFDAVTTTVSIVVTPNVGLGALSTRDSRIRPRREPRPSKRRSTELLT